jgi:hypothetical protein
LKIFFLIGRTGFQKKWNFALISKCAEVLILAKGKIFLQKNRIFRDLENFAKNHFFEKKSLGTS